MEYRGIADEISRLLEDFLHQKGLLLEKAAHALVKALKSLSSATAGAPPKPSTWRLSW
jgi:hypothetical protein